MELTLLGSSTVPMLWMQKATSCTLLTAQLLLSVGVKSLRAGAAWALCNRCCCRFDLVESSFFILLVGKDSQKPAVSYQVLAETSGSQCWFLVELTTPVLVTFQFLFHSRDLWF